jgi:hypothetical protein
MYSKEAGTTLLQMFAKAWQNDQLPTLEISKCQSKLAVIFEITSPSKNKTFPGAVERNTKVSNNSVGFEQVTLSFTINYKRNPGTGKSIIRNACWEL